MSYQVNLLNFEGPLDLLLNLIERSELEITQISLAQVTQQYLDYLGQIPNLDPLELNQFIELAAKLIHIKSQALLPTVDNPEFENDTAELAEQLSRYQHYQKASRYLQDLLSSGQRSWSGPVRASKPNIETVAPQNLDLNILSQAFRSAISKLPPITDNAQLMPKITIEAMIERIQDYLNRGVQSHLSQLLDEAKNRTEVLVLFLGLLELVKSGQIRVRQPHPFDDIELEAVYSTTKP